MPLFLDGSRPTLGGSANCSKPLFGKLVTTTGGPKDRPLPAILGGGPWPSAPPNRGRDPLSVVTWGQSGIRLCGWLGRWGPDRPGLTCRSQGHGRQIPQAAYYEGCGVKRGRPPRVGFLFWGHVPKPRKPQFFFNQQQHDWGKAWGTSPKCPGPLGLPAALGRVGVWGAEVPQGPWLNSRPG